MADDVTGITDAGEVSDNSGDTPDIDAAGQVDAEPEPPGAAQPTTGETSPVSYTGETAALIRIGEDWGIGFGSGGKAIIGGEPGAERPSISDAVAAVLLRREGMLRLIGQMTSWLVQVDNQPAVAGVEVGEPVEPPAEDIH